MSLVVNKQYMQNSPLVLCSGGAQQDVQQNTQQDVQQNTPGNLFMAISKTPTECALGVDKLGNNICSTPATFNDMKKFLNKGDGKASAPDEKILDAVKQKTKCSTEECVLKNKEFQRASSQKNIAESISNLKPSGPAHSTQLLNNKNIDDVLSKLCTKFKNFKHMEFQMIDFAGVKNQNGSYATVNGTSITPTELGTIDMIDDVIAKGNTTFGVVMNTDKRTGNGIHWFSLFCDFKSEPYTIEYFNSSGNKPVREICDWIQKTTTRVREKYKATPVILSGLVHQTASETECGPYSLYYIWNRLNDIPASNFQKKAIPDAEMIKFRQMLFK